MQQVTVQCMGYDVTVRGRNTRAIINSQRFLKWAVWDVLDNTQIQKPVFFTEEWSNWTSRNTLRYALFTVEYDDAHGHQVRTVFFRPNSVAVLVIVRNRETRQRFGVLVEQFRLPAGRMLWEIPAGTMEEEDDGNDGIYKTAIREIREETGFVVEKENLFYMDSCFLSPGACPERVHMLACEIECSPETIRQLEGKRAGLEQENEYIQLRLFKFEDEDILFSLCDAKTVLAYRFYNKYKGNVLYVKCKVAKEKLVTSR